MEGDGNSTFDHAAKHQGNSYFQFLSEKGCLVDVPPPFKASTLHAKVACGALKGDYSGSQK